MNLVKKQGFKGCGRLHESRVFGRFQPALDNQISCARERGRVGTAFQIYYYLHSECAMEEESMNVT